MGLSLRQSPTFVVAIGFAYLLLVTVSSIYFLTYYNPYHVPLSNRLFGAIQREGVFVVVISMAVYLSSYRTATERALSDLRNTLSNLPVPVVVSDAAGLIIYANEALFRFFKHIPQDIVGKNYTDFFMIGISYSKAMRRYITLFETGTNTLSDIDIMPFGETVPILARLSCHGVGSNRTLITAFQPPDSTLREVFDGDVSWSSAKTSGK
jgi:PAS domain-containing protein